MCLVPSATFNITSFVSTLHLVLSRLLGFPLPKWQQTFSQRLFLFPYTPNMHQILALLLVDFTTFFYLLLFHITLMGVRISTMSASMHSQYLPYLSDTIYSSVVYIPHIVVDLSLTIWLIQCGKIAIPYKCKWSVEVPVLNGWAGNKMTTGTVWKYQVKTYIELY